MIRLAPLVLFLSLFLILPDTPGMAEMPAEKVAKKTRVQLDKADNMLDLTGPKIKGLKHDPYYVRTIADPELDVLTVHYLIVEYEFIKANPGRKSGYVMSGRDAYKNFYTAVDDEGNSFKLKVNYRDFDGCNKSVCSFDEYFRITIPHIYFQSHVTSGIRLRARSEAGVYIDLYLYPVYVEGMLQRLEKERAKISP